MSPTAIDETASNGHTTAAPDAVPTKSLSSDLMHYFAQQQQTFDPPEIANGNAFLGDVSTSKDAAAPITSGFFRLEAGKPLVYTYTYHEMKIILEGTFQISEEKTGKKVTATKGDTFYFEKGATITFENVGEGRALAFYTGQREKDAA